MQFTEYNNIDNQTTNMEDEAIRVPRLRIPIIDSQIIEPVLTPPTTTTTPIPILRETSEGSQILRETLEGGQILQERPEVNNKIYDNMLDIFLKTSDYSNNIKRWISENDTTYIDGLEEGFYDLFTITSPISSAIISSIPDELLKDQEVKIFIDEYSMMISELISYTITQNRMWNINLTNKCIWIALMIAIRITHKVIPYITSIPEMEKNKEEILMMEDTYGCTCFILACYNIAAMDELMMKYSSKYITKLTKNNISALDLLVYTGGLISLLESKLISYEECLEYRNQYNMSIIHIASMSDNPTVLDFLIKSGKISQKIMMEKDYNYNIPLMIACMTSSVKAINILLGSKIYDISVMEMKNASSHTLINYLEKEDMIKYFIEHDYINEEIFFNNKIYKLLTIESIFIQFIKSKLFTYELMTKTYNETENVSTTILQSILLKKTKLFEHMINSKESNVKQVNKTLFENIRYILPMSFELNPKLSLIIMKSEYMTEEMLKTKYNENDIMEKIMTHEPTNDTKKIIEGLIEMKYLNGITNDSFLIFCVNTYPELIEKILLGKLIISINAINLLISLKKYKHLLEMLEKGIIDKNNLDEKSIYSLIQCDEKILEYVLDNKLFNKEVLSLLLVENVLIWKTIIKYDISKNILQKFLTNEIITTDILNNYNEECGSIMTNIDKYEELEVLINSRSDLDHNLLFRGEKETTNLFVKNCIKGENNIIEYLVKHPLFPSKQFDELSKIPIDKMIKIFENKMIAQILITNQNLNKSIINENYGNGNNLLQHIIINKYAKDCIATLINNKNMTGETFLHQNEEGDNCLILALKNNIKCNDIINSKHFDPLMMLAKNKNGQSVESILYDVTDIDILTKYLQYYPSMEILTQKNKSGNTLIHKLLQDYINYNDILTLILQFGIEILTIKNDKGNTGFHMLILYYNTEAIKTIVGTCNIINQERNLNLKECFYEQNNTMDTPITYIIQKQNEGREMFEYMISIDYVTEDDMNRKVYQYLLIEYIISICHEMIYILEKNNFDINKILRKKNMNDKMLIYTLIDAGLKTKDKTYAKYMTNDMLDDVIIKDIMTIDQLLFIELMNKKIINSMIIDKFLTEIILNHNDIAEYIIKNVPEIFTIENMVKCILACTEKNSLNLELLTGSQYYDEKVIKKIQDEQQIISKMTKSMYGLRFILNNKLMTDEILARDNYKIIFTLNNPNYIKELCMVIDDAKIMTIKNEGKTIIDKCSEYPNIIWSIICKKNILIKSLITNKSKTFIDTMIENEFISDIENIFNHCNEETILEIISRQNYEKKNILMKICESDKLRHLIMGIDKKFFTPEILCQKDFKNKMTIEYICQYVPILFNKILQTNMNTISKFITNEDINGENLLTTLTRYSPNNLMEILENEEVKKIKHFNFNKCFIIACKYQPRSIGILIGKVDLTNCYGMIEFDEQIYPANYFQIACRYEPESVKNLIKSNIDLTEVLNEVYEMDLVKFNAFKLAILYEPKAVEYILSSKYANQKLIDDTNKLMKKNCLIDSLYKQVGSFIKIMTSKLGQNYAVSQENGIIMNKFSEITHHYDFNDPLFKFKDKPCSVDHIDVCPICCENEKRAIYIPCGHKTCVMCAIKLDTCPQCRAQIKSKIVYN